MQLLVENRNFLPPYLPTLKLTIQLNVAHDGP